MKSSQRVYDTSSLVANPDVTTAYEIEIENIFGYQDTIQRLDAALNNFEKNLVRLSKENEFLDVNLARSLYVKSCALLRICQKVTSAPYVPYALAAVSYFVNEKDGVNDTDAIDGFEDDQLVLAHLIDHFNLEDTIANEINEIQNI